MLSHLLTFISNFLKASESLRQIQIRHDKLFHMRGYHVSCLRNTFVNTFHSPEVENRVVRPVYGEGENTADKTKTDECTHFLSGLSLQVQFKKQETLKKCYIQLIKEV